MRLINLADHFIIINVKPLTFAWPNITLATCLYGLMLNQIWPTSKFRKHVGLLFKLEHFQLHLTTKIQTNLRCIHLYMMDVSHRLYTDSSRWRPFKGITDKLYSVFRDSFQNSKWELRFWDYENFIGQD